VDDQKILEVIQTYRNFFQEKGIEPIDYPHDLMLESLEKGFSHCYGMLSKMEEFIREGRREKAFRWLGFIQGFLWASNSYSLEELRNHSRPDE